MNLTNKKVLMVVAPKNFRDEELLEPKRILEQKGALITIASKGSIQQAIGKLGAVVNIDTDYTQINTNDFAAVIWVGGAGASTYFDDPLAHNLLQTMYQQNKIVAAICIAPVILAYAGILQGKKATCFPTNQNDIQQKGAYYTGELVTVDGTIITASGPEAAQLFGEKIAELLA